MVFEKETKHKFSTNDLEIELEEYPHDGGYEPRATITLDNIKYISLGGNPSDQLSLCLQTDEGIIWLKTPPELVDKLQDEIVEFKIRWSKEYTFNPIKKVKQE